MSQLGERGEVVNTSGCEPDIRQFDSDYPPHLKNLSTGYSTFFVKKTNYNKR